MLRKSALPQTGSAHHTEVGFCKRLARLLAVFSVVAVMGGGLACGQPPWPEGAVIRLGEAASGFEAILDGLATNGTTATIIVDQSVALTEDRAGTEKSVPSHVALEFYPGNPIDLNNHDLEINGVVRAGFAALEKRNS